MNYEYEYIKLKAKYKRMEQIYRKRLEKANQDKDEMFNKISNPVSVAQFDMDFVDLLKQVSIVTRVTVTDIIGKCRKKEYVLARQLFCYYARIHSNKTFSAIGSFMNVDHSTVIHHVKRWQDYMDLNYQPEVGYYKILNANVGAYITETERISPHFS